MSVDLMITQKGLLKKPLPLSVIIGDRLGYGRYDDHRRLEEGRFSDAEFTAFLPEALGRGITVFWSKGEKKEVMLRLLTPTCREEIREFYQMVRRIMDHWNATLEVEGEKARLDSWLAGMEDLIAFNTQALRSFCEEILEGKAKDTTLSCAVWPLTMGLEEASRCADDIEAFEAWLHDCQSVDAYYASPRFFRKDGRMVGHYVLSEGRPAIFPNEPSVPAGTIDPGTGRLLKCEEFRVDLYLPQEKEFLGDLSFDEYRARLPKEKADHYDGGHYILSPFTREELEKLRDPER